MVKKYVMVVRDQIITSSSKTDETYKCLDCYYKSPSFVSDGTWQSFDKAIDLFHDQFKHFISWSAVLVELK